MSTNLGPIIGIVVGILSGVSIVIGLLAVFSRLFVNSVLPELKVKLSETFFTRDECRILIDERAEHKAKNVMACYHAKLEILEDRQNQNYATIHDQLKSQDAKIDKLFDLLRQK